MPPKMKIKQLNLLQTFEIRGQLYAKVTEKHIINVHSLYVYDLADYAEEEVYIIGELVPVL